MTTTSHDSQPRAACPDCRGLRILLAVASVAACLGGFVTSSLLHRERVRVEGQRRFLEFLLVADDWGILDRSRLDEIVCTVSEAQWGDIDSESGAFPTNASEDEAP